jgi:hypothetical protein
MAHKSVAIATKINIRAKAAAILSSAPIKTNPNEPEPKKGNF